MACLCLVAGTVNFLACGVGLSDTLDAGLENIPAGIEMAGHCPSQVRIKASGECGTCCLWLSSAGQSHCLKIQSLEYQGLDLALPAAIQGSIPQSTLHSLVSPHSRAGPPDFVFLPAYLLHCSYLI